MSFIQVQQSLVTHRKTLRLARLLGENRYTVVGRLVAFWSWCLDNALDGCLGKDIDADVLADVMGWGEQQGKPSELLEALITAGFLDMDPHDLHLCIHDWDEHMGRLIEKREQDADRKRRQRERERQEREAERESGHESQQAETSAPAVTLPAADVTRMSRGRHWDVTHQSRVEKKRVEENITTGRDGSVERENAHAQAQDDDAARAADAALTLLAPAPSSASSSAQPPSPTAPPNAPPNVTPLHAPPATGTTGARIPDPVWDACIASMGAAPSNRVERGKWAKGIQALKESLAADGSPPSEIVTRARRYRTRFGPSVPLNPMALAGNWTTLATDIPQAQEGQRHGQSGQSRSAAAFGRSPSEWHDGRAGRPQVGSPEYYEQAEARARAERYARAGRGSGEGQRNAVVG